MMLSNRSDADCCASSGLSLTSRCKMPVEMVSSTMLTVRVGLRNAYLLDDEFVVVPEEVVQD